MFIIISDLKRRADTLIDPQNTSVVITRGSKLRSWIIFSIFLEKKFVKIYSPLFALNYTFRRRIVSWTHEFNNFWRDADKNPTVLLELNVVFVTPERKTQKGRLDCKNITQWPFQKKQFRTKLKARLFYYKLLFKRPIFEEQQLKQMEWCGSDDAI